MKASLDTNVALRLIVGDIPDQQEKARQLIEAGGALFSVADLVFIEIEHALRMHYGFSRKQITQVLELFIEHSKINCNRQLLRRSLPFYSSHPAVSLTDVCLATYAELNNAVPLWTFDKKLAGQLEGAQLVD